MDMKEFYVVMELQVLYKYILIVLYIHLLKLKELYI